MGRGGLQMLEISLLGDLRIAIDGQVVTAVRSPRTQALLAYLLVHRWAPQPRQRLAFLFWPDSTEAQARTNLRRELHRLRQCLPEVDLHLDLAGPALWWRPDPPFDLDVAVFEDAVAASERAATAGDAAAFRAAAERAVRAYRGRLLPAIYDDWVAEERERLHRSCLSVLDRLVGALDGEGQLDDAAAHAKRRIALEPLEESGYAALIDLAARGGDRAAAIRAFHQCAEVLERELGTRPGPETVARYETAMARGARLGAAPLVGRRREQEQLLAIWRQPGRARMAAITGEAGIGKSRLADWLCGAVEHGGAPVARARCFAAFRGLPLAPLRSWFAGPALAAAVRSLDEPWRREIARLVPAGAGAGPLPMLRDPRSGGGRRARLFEALAMAVAAVGSPQMLYLDDVQWCDTETLEWLAFLFQSVPAAPVLVVVTARVEDLHDRTAVAGALRDLRGLGVVVDVELGPLSAGETAELARHALGRTPEPAAAARLHDATGGFPLFVVELAALWEEGTTLPPRVRAVLHGRLRSLSPAARRVLDLASVIGRDFSLDLLCDAGDLDEDAVVEAIDELWRRRLVRAVGPGAYDVGHDLLRDAVLDELGPPNRWRLHRRVARALEAQYRRGGTGIAAGIASHYEQAGQFGPAARFHLAAATNSARVFAYGEAIDRCEHALQLAGRLPSGVERDHLELQIRFELAAPLNAVDGYASTRLQAVLERARALASHLDEPRWLIRCLVGLWAVHFVRGDINRSADLGLQAFRLCGDHPDLAPQVHLALGGSLTSLGRPREGIEHLAMADADGSEVVFGFRPSVMALAWGAHARWLAGHPVDALADADRAVAVADDPYSQTVAHAYGAITRQMSGDRDGAAAHAAAAMSLCDEYGFGYYREWAMVLGGWAGGGARGIAGIEDALVRLRAQNADSRRPYYLGLLADACRRAGEPARAARALAEGIRLARRNGDRWWEPELLRMQAALGPATGQAALEQAARLAADQGSDALAHRARADLAGY